MVPNTVWFRQNLLTQLVSKFGAGITNSAYGRRTAANPAAEAHHQTVHGPNFPPSRFARCYRCGCSNLSILVGPEKPVKLFGGKPLRAEQRPICHAFLKKLAGAGAPTWRCLPCGRSTTQYKSMTAKALQHAKKASGRQCQLHATPWFAKVGSLEKLSGICRKFWLFRRKRSDSLFRGQLQARSSATATVPLRRNCGELILNLVSTEPWAMAGFCKGAPIVTSGN